MTAVQVLWSLLHHPMVLTVAAAWFTAQAVKVVIHFFRAGRMDWKLLAETGGMPSSHSALVTSMTTCVGMQAGWDSAPFLVALGFSIITMHDAAGLRMAAGRQAALLNQVVESLYQGRQAKPPRMKELLGHSPLQVLSGGALGIAVALALFPILR
jgi:acid phosphatase family membrane protein YuiD